MRQRTQEGWPKAHHMMVPVEQGHFLRWLVATLNVRKAVEVGVFTGSSALAIAQVRCCGVHNSHLCACDKEFNDVRKAACMLFIDMLLHCSSCCLPRTSAGQNEPQQSFLCRMLTLSPSGICHIHKCSAGLCLLLFLFLWQGAARVLA